MRYDRGWGNWYIKIAILASAVNPTPAVIIAIGAYKVYKLIVAGSAVLAARIGTVGGIILSGASALRA